MCLSQDYVLFSTQLTSHSCPAKLPTGLQNNKRIMKRSCTGFHKSLQYFPPWLKLYGTLDLTDTLNTKLQMAWRTFAFFCQEWAKCNGSLAAQATLLLQRRREVPSPSKKRRNWKIWSAVHVFRIFPYKMRTIKCHLTLTMGQAVRAPIPLIWLHMCIVWVN